MKLRALISMVLAVALSAGSYAAESPEDFLQGLYKVHVSRYIKDVYWFNNKRELAKYYDSELTLLFLRDEQCKEKTQEICRLNFDPILDAQDFDEKGSLNLNVQKIPHKTKNLYKVTFNNGGVTTLVYELRQTSGGWRIADIIYSEGLPLKKILSSKY